MLRESLAEFSRWVRGKLEGMEENMDIFRVIYSLHRSLSQVSNLPVYRPVISQYTVSNLSVYRLVISQYTVSNLSVYRLVISQYTVSNLPVQSQ